MELPRTLSKFHYIFSLRDLSRICAGILLTTVVYMKTSGLFVRVWRNEFIRVICDRLISMEVRSILTFYLLNYYLLTWKKHNVSCLHQSTKCGLSLISKKLSGMHWQSTMCQNAE
jgi:hypothetical protein